MGNLSGSPSPDRNGLLLDFPVRLYTALRTIRLYPASNPQVQRSNDFVVKACTALLAANEENGVNLAVSDGKILVCGERLPDKDHARPQIQGLVTLLNRLKIHSFTFRPSFSFNECLRFTAALSGLLSEKELSAPVASLLEQAGITSVSVDSKRYVAIHDGEQVVRDELIGSGLNISDEELANFVLGKTGVDPLHSVSPELVQELISRLPAADNDRRAPEEVTRAVIDFLGELSRETDAHKQRQELEQSAAALSRLDPALLAKLVAALPPSPDADAILGSALHKLTPQRLNALIANLVEQQDAQTGAGGTGRPGPENSAPLNRLTRLEAEPNPALSQAIARNLDARSLLANPNTTLAELPEHLLQRLQQPEWSAPVLAAAAQQAVGAENHAGGQIDFNAFNHMLGHYEQLLSREQQGQVARQAGAQLASMEGLALGNILAQRFKGLFGEQLYSQVVNQVSDELLDETIEHLTPRQINRMVATLTSDIPLQIGKDQDPNFQPVDDSVLKRLARTRRGPEIARAVAQNIDARRLLVTPGATDAELPEQLRQRLQRPEWSAPVLAAAVQQTTESQDGRVDVAAFNSLLARYEQLLSREQQGQVARQAGAQLASMEGLALGNILAQKFKGLFGEQLYQQVLTQVSDQLLDETVEHLNTKQLNRMVATLTSDIPLQIGKDTDPDFKAADDSVLKRLAQTKKGPEIARAVAQHIDARQLLLNPGGPAVALPAGLQQRLQQPEWSAPVLAAAAQRVVDPDMGNDGPADFPAFNRVLGQYEQLLSPSQQSQVACQAGAQLASMEGVALGNIVAHKFKGLFGEQLYKHVVSQVTDELLDKTIDHLTPRQLNRMIAALTSDIPLQVGKNKDLDFKPADDSILKRLAQTHKGPEITKVIAQNIDAQVLRASQEPTSALPDRLAMRLQQPAWSAPVLVAAAQQSLETVDPASGQPDLSSFEQMIERYNALLNKEKQLQVATQAGAQIATFDEKELGVILVQKYKNLFGEQLYQQVIAQLSEDKLERLTGQLQAFAEGRAEPDFALANKEVEAAYNRLMQTVRGEKMRAIIEMHREQKKLQEQERSLSIRGGLDKLLGGDLKDLANAEICQALPDTVRNLLLENNGAKADNLLMQLAIALQHKQPEIGANAFQTLAEIAGQLAELGQWDRLAKLLPALEQGLQRQDVTSESSKQALGAIGRLTAHRLTEENYAQAYDTAHFLQTASTATEGNRLVREQALEALKNLCTPPALQQLLDRYLHSEPHQEIAGKLLVELGMDSARFQLQQLFVNESRHERNRLLALIKQTGNPAVSILLEQLHKDSPWFVARNVIRLLGDIGNPALFSTVRPFINHSDLRVQQEVISTAVKIGGANLKDFLLHALQNVDDSLKVKVIAHAAQAHDERFVRPLTDLLESAKPFLGKNKNDLQIGICKTLGAIGSKRATAPLNRVVQSKNVLGIAGYSDEVRQAAALALEQIRQAAAVARERSDGAWGERQEEAPARPAASMSATDVQAAETEIFDLVAQGRAEQAKKQLIDLIAATARSGDFPTAERLRERIYEIDALPLGEIIRSGEIIDEEKRGAVKGEDLEIWSDLTDRLSSKEFQSIYHEFIERRYKPEETIVAQGDKNDALLFINQGSVKVSHLVGSRELFITSLNRGQIAGENFFTPSFWTVTLTSLTPSRLYFLPQTALNLWQEQFPGLRAKLHEYYASCNNIRSMLEKKGLERRRDQRFSLSRKIQVQPISSLDQPIGRGFRSETADISLGGLAFLIRISRQENARLLLGRRMQVVLPVGGKTGHLTLKGLVIGIQPFQLLENDYSAHFKFDQPLDKQALQSILG
jgi:CRP-like cAMP-binding protein